MKFRLLAVAPLMLMATSCRGTPGDNAEDDTYAPGSLVMSLLGIPSEPVESRRQEFAIQDALADCMRAEGFEYVPFDRGAGPADSAWGSLAFGEEYGYGVMRNYELSGGSPYLEPIPPDVVDPNDAIVAELSLADQQAYTDARFGDFDEYDRTVDADGNELASPSLEQQGCQGKARLEVVGEDASADPEIDALLQRWQAPQLEAEVLTSKWIDCIEPTLDDLGFGDEVRRIDDGYRIMSTALFTAMGLEVVESDDAQSMFAASKEMVTAWQYEDGTGYYVFNVDHPRELSGAQIDGLTDREIELWAADFACQEEVGYRDYLQQREQAVIDQILAVRPDLAG